MKRSTTGLRVRFFNVRIATGQGLNVDSQLLQRVSAVAMTEQRLREDGDEPATDSFARSFIE
jgi:hypothetical protein